MLVVCVLSGLYWNGFRPGPAPFSPPSSDLRCQSYGLVHKCRDLHSHALWLLSNHPLIDGHIDIPVLAKYRYNNKISDIPFDQAAHKNGSWPMQGHVDLPRLREGKSGGFFWSAYVPCPDPSYEQDNFARAPESIAVRDTLEQLDVIRQFTSRYSSDFALVGTAKQARHAFSGHGKMIAFIGIEGAHSLGNSLFALRTLSALAKNDKDTTGPVRYLTLTHTCHNAFADSAGPEEPKWNGLSPLGYRLVDELGRLGIVPDLSHVSDQTAEQTIQSALGPVMLSHSSARHFTDLRRNVPDSVLRLLASYSKDNAEARKVTRGAKDSVVMINVFPGFIGGTEDLVQVVRHIEYVAEIVGKTHVGLGTDFDGIFTTPKGLSDVSQYPNLVVELLKRGWSDVEIAGFVGENVLRVLESAEHVAEMLARQGVEPDNTSWEDIFSHPKTEL
ncbi:hypothetical protein BCV70DRAFT_201850 [Testicularia cyperi]|uniref:Dipeptidase n=1 Tax=Testicularia cyperi TaxID=1882483 RepID=A0A317XJQ2_9BASI|nr:hypothetical protein BCV70DRAFT_201850 [Testicularia cyperi]